MQKDISWIKLHVNRHTIWIFFLEDIFGCYCSSSLHWQGREDKNLLVVHLDIHVVIFIADLSKGKESIAPNNNKPPTCWFSSQMNSSFLY
jgi:hypothetical protein